MTAPAYGPRTLIGGVDPPIAARTVGPGATRPELAYADAALPIARGQTISQPYVIALMLQALQLRSGDRVLEIGTGSGYSTAVLSQLVHHVDSVERIPELADTARERLATLGFD